MGSAAFPIEADLYIPAVKHYHPAICSSCYVVGSIESPLLRCSQCHLISYCSKSCQKLDWTTHRSVCVVNKVRKGNIFSSAKEILSKECEKLKRDLWYQLRCNLALACSVNLKRRLSTQEREIFFFPKVCEVCKGSNSSLLRACESCFSVFYCSYEHQEVDRSEHSNWCSDYLVCLQCDILEARSGVQDLPLPTLVDDVYKLLDRSLMAILEDQLQFNTSKPLDLIFLTKIGERLSFPLSLLYALEQLKLKGRSDLQSSLLTVHVVGASSSVELVGLVRWEYILHRLPHVMRLHIIFIGPDVLKTGESVDDLQRTSYFIDESGATRCEDCARRKRLVIYEMVSALYHEFHGSSYYCEPNLIVVFNCGFYENAGSPADTWPNSLKIITESKIPLVFTSYTKLEAKKDLKIVKQISNGIQMEIEPHLNPMRSPRPLRDPARDDSNPLYFCNQYLTCVM